MKQGHISQEQIIGTLLQAEGGEQTVAVGIAGTSRSASGLSVGL